MDWRAQTIQNIFGGDEQRFEKAYDEAALEAIREAISWDDLNLNATVLVNWETQTKELIEKRLGYLPHPAISLRYEPYLRALLQNRHQGLITSEVFRQEADEHLKLIRNVDMEQYSGRDYAPHFKQMYQKMFEFYGVKAKERLKFFLGYEPAAEHSLLAELWLWDVMSKNIILPPGRPTAVDYKALTIIRYREILYLHDKINADKSDLSGEFPDEYK